MLRILALGKYGELAASSRQRMVQFVRPLHEFGISLDFEGLLSNEYVQAIAEQRGVQVWPLVRSYLRRMWQLLQSEAYDGVWVQSDLLPYVPGNVETALLPRAVPVVYDCDDAFFQAYAQSRNPIVRHVLGRKLVPLLRRASAATCGNDYLKAYVERYCDNTTVVPTVVDTATYVPRRHSGASTSGAVAIGWVGSPSTWSYVQPLTPVFRDLVIDGTIKFRAIGVGPKSRTIGEFEFVDWSLENEIAAIQQLDVGVMPLIDDAWSKGKCGYKLIQYMACGLPVVASPVGVNARIVSHGRNGFLASSEAEWREALCVLAGDPLLRRRMGEAGRQLVENEYSLRSQIARVAQVLRSAAG